MSFLTRLGNGHRELLFDRTSFSARKAPTLATVMCKSNASHCQHPIAPRELINQNREEAEDVNASDPGELIFRQTETHDGNNPTKPKYRRGNVGCENKKQQKNMCDFIGAQPTNQ